MSTQGRGPTTEIEITPAMIAAGLEELRDHNYAGDTDYMLECVYRAMAYAARDQILLP